jgi:hypothetical protein
LNLPDLQWIQCPDDHRSSTGKRGVCEIADQS